MVEIFEHESDVLKSNPLGDPHRRKIHVYLPPQYKTNSQANYPALLALTGFTGTGGAHFNVETLSENLEQRLDRLIGSGSCKPVIIVAVDCFNKFGGSQYINSTAIGKYEDYLIQEILPTANKKYRISRWGVFGKSSGGYGSMVLGMKYADRFVAFATHSGDSSFELSYIHEFAAALDGWREAGGPKKWFEKFWADNNRRRRKYQSPLNMLAMSAHYSPNPKSIHLGIDFPFDLDTGDFKPEVWERWRQNDPLHMVDRYIENLRKLRLIYIDCGSKDEFALYWGARSFAKKLRDNGVECLHEEFDDGHMNIQYRYDRSLPMLAEACSRE